MKTISSLVIGACIVIFVLCAPIAAQAETNAATSPGLAASPESSAAFRGKISSVDAKARTFSITGKETRVIKITDQTRIMKQGAEAMMKDIVTDEEARGSYWKKGDGFAEPRILAPLTRTSFCFARAARQRKIRIGEIHGRPD